MLFSGALHRFLSICLPLLVFATFLQCTVGFQAGESFVQSFLDTKIRFRPAKGSIFSSFISSRPALRPQPAAPKQRHAASLQCSVDSDLQEFLQDKDLLPSAALLSAVGVVKVPDLLELDDEDIDQMQIPLVQAKRLKRILGEMRRERAALRDVWDSQPSDNALVPAPPPPLSN
mmetsp:Transcript_6581/g.13020  ORF Transcript_6581/g.13020 Transcript_6581/m.13020 type:complete len:174 (-) Transcript_6581:151-672(-)